MQIEAFQHGLLGAVLEKRADGAVIRKSGIMAIVLCGGRVRPGDSIFAELPAPPFLPLERV
jgi:MOSC domain-containing protein YiiM